MAHAGEVGEADNGRGSVQGRPVGEAEAAELCGCVYGGEELSKLLLVQPSGVDLPGDREVVQAGAMLEQPAGEVLHGVY